MKRTRARAFLLCLMALAATRTIVLQEPGESQSRRPIQPAVDAPQPLSPAESAAKLHLPEGFRAELVASEPLISDPSCLAFDERGRLFVCELRGYNIEGHLDVTELNKTGELDREVRRIRWELRGGEIAEEARKLQRGVVKLLEDTDRDGVMDRAEVWADDLPPCYGIVAARGGVIVVCAPDIIFFADRDGDGRPEIRETLFTGFRARVLERGINNPRHGLDSWIYVGSSGEGGTISGPHLATPVSLGSSDFRIRADGSAIEPVNGRVGTFGMTINDVGDRFPATGGQPATYALPLEYRSLSRNPHVPTPRTTHSAANYGRGFRRSTPHPWRVRRRQDPDWVKFYGDRETDSNYFTGGCSNEFYGDALFPEAYRGSLFYCEPSLNIVHRCVLTRDGAAYRARRAEREAQSEFLASEDQWFRPMNLRVGPEGALYVVDMYREIIEDYSAIPRFLQQQYGLARGNEHGRVWRIVPEGAGRRSIPDLSKLDVLELARLTDAPEAWTRLTAQRLLVERGDGEVSGLLGRRLRERGSPRGCIHALHTLDGLGALDSRSLLAALDHEDYRVRVHALRLAGRSLASDEALLESLVSLIDDPDPRVRLECALALGESRDERAVDALGELARRHGAERWMAAAILSSANESAGAILIELLRAAQAGKNADALLAPLAMTIGGRRDVEAMQRVLTALAIEAERVQVACLEGFVAGVSRGETPVPRSPDGGASLSRLLDARSAPVRELAAALGARLPVAKPEELARIFADAAARVRDTSLALETRLASLRVIASAAYEILAPAALELLDATQAPALQRGAVEALGSSTDERVGEALVERWPALSPKIRDDVLAALLANENRLAALVDALEDKVIRRADLDAIQRERLLAARDENLAHRASALFEDTAAAEDLRKRTDLYARSLAGKRDTERGQALFVEHCTPCHKHEEAGADVGPALGSTKSKPDEAILVDVLDPSATIESEYRTYIVVTKAGLSFTGILASESPTSVTLQREKGASDVILRGDIAIMKAAEVSLMPSNLHEQLSPRDLADVIGFLRLAFGAVDVGSPAGAR